MTASMSTRFPPLPPESLRGKVAHLTVAACMLVCGGLFIVSAWDELNCVAGEVTSSGACGIGLTSAATLVVVGIFLVLIGGIVLFRAIRRRVNEDGADGWRVAQAIVVIICGVLMALMIPLMRCPPGTTLSPVFRFCVNQEVSYPAPSPGLPWKIAALVLGVVLGVLMIRWRSMPIWLATVFVVAASVGTALYIVWRTTGIPGFHASGAAIVPVMPQVVMMRRFRIGARPARRRGRRS
jgi:hypothetical protein